MHRRRPAVLPRVGAALLAPRGAAAFPRAGLLLAACACAALAALPLGCGSATPLPVGPIIPNNFGSMWVYTYMPTNFSVPQMGFVGLVNGMDFAWRVSHGPGVMPPAPTPPRPRILPIIGPVTASLFMPSTVWASHP
jgi:hypothetical protein